MAGLICVALQWRIEYKSVLRENKAMNNKIFFNGLLLVTAAIVQSCGFYNSKQTALTPGGPNTSTNNGTGTTTTTPGGSVTKVGISYLDVQQKVFAPSCVSCHSNGNASGGVALDTYSSVVVNLQRAKSAISGGVMPPSGNMSQTQVQILSDWIAQGAPQVAIVVTTTPSPTPTPPTQSVTPTPTPVVTPTPSLTLTPTFSSIKANVFAAKCMSCHSSSGSQSSRPLDNYANMMAKGLVVAGSSANSPVVQTIQDGSMPPRGVSVTAAELSVIQQWIQLGAPNN